MLLIVIALCALLSVIVAARRRDFFSAYLLGMSLSNLLMLLGIVIYIAKMGGVAASRPFFLFLLKDIQHWLRFYPVSMNILGYMTAVGRTLFPYFLLLLALEVTMVPWARRRMRMLRVLTFVPPALFLIYYYPKVFYTLVRGRFWLLTAMIPISMAWILVYLAVSLMILILEYRATTIHFFRANFRYILLSTVSISALYLLYAVKDPAQIYNMFVGEYIRLGIDSYISPYFTVMGWLLLLSCTIFFIILGGYAMIRYTQVEYPEGDEELTLQRKFDAAGMGVTVFVHGIKNQLLASRVLHKRLTRVLDGDQPDIAQARACALQLKELNDGMLDRMDELYRAVKSSALSLSPVPIGAVVDTALQRLKDKYPDARVEVRLECARLVLADAGALGEAVYNLITNGYEAAVQAGRSPEVQVITRAERLWTVLEVRDNGAGIPPEIQGQIFEPFFTSKNTSYNWGMGLFYVRKIVKSHWGLLRLESQPDRGSSFFIMLPLFDADRKE